jgi:4-hydroxy 2-oxovalerate aldolase
MRIYHDWKFGRANLVSIFERLVDANVDIIEVGFLDDRRPFVKDRSIFPDTTSAGQIYGYLDKKGALAVGMIDLNLCNRNLQLRRFLAGGIRVIFKKGKMHPAMEFCPAGQNVGYKVFAQLVSVTSFTDAELLELVELVNDVKPFAVSMVDTYGVRQEALLHIYRFWMKHVSKADSDWYSCAQ